MACQAPACAAVGAAAGIGLTILNLLGMEIPYVLILAVIAGITELIPLIGPILGSIPAIILLVIAQKYISAGINGGAVK